MPTLDAGVAEGEVVMVTQQQTATGCRRHNNRRGLRTQPLPAATERLKEKTSRGNGDHGASISTQGQAEQISKRIPGI